MKKLDHSIIILVSIVFLGLGLRLDGIRFGLPYIYQEDEFLLVSKATGILSTQDLNPHWFGQPGTTVIYLLSLLYVLIFMIGFMTGSFAHPSEYRLLYTQDPTLFYLSGRLMCVLAGVATIVLIFFIGRRLFDRPTGLVAALGLAVCPLHVEHSRIIRPDILMTLLVLIGFWFCLECLQRQTWSAYLWAGLFTGIAVATKYPAVIIAITILCADLFQYPWQWRPFSKVIGAGIASLFGAFFSSPFLFLDFQTVLFDLGREARPFHPGATSEGYISNVIWYIREYLINNIGYVGLLMAVGGMIWCLCSKRKEYWLLLTFPLSFFLFINTLTLRWGRWLIPLLPFLWIFVAVSLVTLFQWLKHRWNRQGALAVVLVMLLGLLIPLLHQDIVTGSALSGQDTRTVMREWMLAKIPRGSKILLEKYTPQLPKEWYQYFIIDEKGNLRHVPQEEIRHTVFRALSSEIGLLRDVSSVCTRQVDYFLISALFDANFSERLQHASHVNSILTTYENLIKLGRKIHEVRAIPEENISGPTIRIYQVNCQN